MYLLERGYKLKNFDGDPVWVQGVYVVVENMLFVIIQSYRTSRQIDLNINSLSMGN